MLHGNAETLPAVFSGDIPVLHKLILLCHLSGISQKFLSLGGNLHSPVASAKQGNSDFLFQLPDRLGQAGLGNKKRPCRLVHGTGVCNCNHIAQLCKCHFFSLFLSLKKQTHKDISPLHASARWFYLSISVVKIMQKELPLRHRYPLCRS